jgi:hypothetical protein
VEKAANVLCADTLKYLLTEKGLGALREKQITVESVSRLTYFEAERLEFLRA